MGVNIKQATYSGPDGFGIKGDPQVPSSGESQPLLDTSNNSGPGPGVVFKQATYSGFPGDPPLEADHPDSATIPLNSTDVQNQDAPGSDATPPDIFKGSKSNG